MNLKCSRKYIILNHKRHLDQKLLNLSTDVLDLGGKLRRLVGEDTATDHRSGNTASSAKGDLGGDENVSDVLILAQKRKVEEDLQGLGVGRHDDQVGDTSVEGLGGLVGTLLQLLVVGSLLHQVKDGHGELGVGEGVSFGVDLSHC